MKITTFFERLVKLKYLRIYIGAFYIVIFIFAAGGMLWGNQAETFLKRGKDYFGLFQYSDAYPNLEKAVSLDPSNFEAHYYLGLTLKKLNKFDRAAAELEAALKLSPDDTDCRKALGSLYLQLATSQNQAGNRQKMIEYLKKACLANPQDTSAWVTLYENLSATQSWQEIAEMASQLRRHNSEALEAGDDGNLQKALILAAKAFIALRDHGTAREYLNQAGRIRIPNDELIRLKSQLVSQATKVATNLLDEGRAAFEAGDYKKALDLLEKARGADSNNDEINDLIEKSQKLIAIKDFIIAANAAEKRGDWEAALERLQHAQEFDEDNREIKARIASITAYLEKKEAAEAKAKAEAMAKSKAQMERAQKLAALLKAAQESEHKKAFDAALLSYKQALELSNEKDEIQAAIERVQKSAEAEQARKEAYRTEFNAALKLVDGGNFAEAYSALEKLLEDPLNPREEIIPLILKSAAALQRWDDLDKYIAKLVETGSSSDDIDYYTGLSAFRKGEYEKARNALSALKSRNPTYAPDVGKMLWRIWFEKYKWGIYITLFLICFKLLGPINSMFKRMKAAHKEAALESALKSGDYAKAIPLLETRLSEIGYGNKRKQLTLSLADAYLHEKRYADAAAKASEILSKDTKNATALRILGESAFQSGDTSSLALEHVAQLYQLDETRKDLLSYLAAQYRVTQQESKTALEILTRQMQFFPEDKETIFYLADLYAMRGNFAPETLKAFERAAFFAPDSIKYHIGYLKALLQAGRVGEAERALEKALKFFPNDAELIRIQSRIKTQQGEVSEEEVFIQPRVQSTVSSAGTGAAGAVCPHCGQKNSSRDYYCSSCGKPIR